MLKLLRKDLNKKELTDVKIILIDKNHNEYSMDLHKVVLGLQSEVFKRTFKFSNKDTYIFGDLDSIEIAKAIILTLYGIISKVKTTQDALYLVRTCNFFGIPLDFNRICNLDYIKNIDHLIEIFYYIESPNFPLIKPLDEKQVTKIKARYWLLPNIFFNTNFNNGINVNYTIDNKIITDKYIEYKEPIESFYEINGRIFMYTKSTINELLLKEKIIFKYFGIDNNNFIVYDNKFCHLSQKGLLSIFDISQTIENGNYLVNQINFKLPSEIHYYRISVIIPVNYKATYMLVGIIGDFDAIVVSRISINCSKTNLIYCFRENNEDINNRSLNTNITKKKILEKHKFCGNENNDSPIIIDQLDNNIFHEMFNISPESENKHQIKIGRYYWNNKQQCAIFVCNYITNSGKTVGKSEYNYIKIIDYNNPENECIIENQSIIISQTNKFLFINSRKFPIVAYVTMDNDKKFCVILLNLSTKSKEIIYECDSVYGIEFTCDDEILVIYESKSISLYSIREDRFIYYNVENENIYNFRTVFYCPILVHEEENDKEENNEEENEIETEKQIINESGIEMELEEVN